MAVITKNAIGWAAGLVGIALFAAACGGAASPEAVGQAESDPATAPATTEEISDENEVADSQAGAEADPAAVAVPEALQFTAPLVGGGEIDLAANFDNKPTLLWFWAPT